MEVRFRCDFYLYSPESAAFDLGFERAGWQCVGQVEIEPFCQKVLAKHWPNVWRWDDVRTVTGELIREHCGDVDAIVGGFPCQDISVAGKGEGLGGARSSLYWEIHRLAMEIRPTWLLLENVPALRTRGADEVLLSLAEAGYVAWPFVVGADDLGASHRRKRVWIVGYANGIGSGAGARLSTFGQDGLSDADRAGWRSADAGWRFLALSDSGRSRSSDRNALHEGRRTGNNGAEGVPQATGWANGLAVGDAESTSGDVADAVRDRCGNGAGQSQCIAECGRAANAGASFTRWPARPGQPQHEWEEPRTIESALGGAVDGLSSRLAGRHRVAALKALGNAVVPQVAEVIGRAILQTQEAA